MSARVTMTGNGGRTVRQPRETIIEIDPHDPARTVPPGPIGIRCIACGSDDLDASEHPRGDEVVQCRHCGDWNTYRALELAAVEAVRRELARRLSG